MESRPQTAPEIRQRIWMELGRAAQDRHHAWRTPVIATVDSGGMPNARTVVLRAVDASRTQLQFYTDARSPKVGEIIRQPCALLVFWSKRLNWQLRVRAGVTIRTEGPDVEAVWDRVSQSASAGDYLSSLAPGDILASPDAGSGPAAAAGTMAEASRHQLAIITTQVTEIDWLELARGGHRRARIGAESWDWVAP